MLTQKARDILEAKIKENETELQAAVDELSKVHGFRPKNPEEAGKMLLLKDKVLFFKTAVTVLRDLEQTLKESKDV